MALPLSSVRPRGFSKQPHVGLRPSGENNRAQTDPPPIPEALPTHSGACRCPECEGIRAANRLWLVFGIRFEDGSSCWRTRPMGCELNDMALPDEAGAIIEALNAAWIYIEDAKYFEEHRQIPLPKGVYATRIVDAMGPVKIPPKQIDPEIFDASRAPLVTTNDQVLELVSIAMADVPADAEWAPRFQDRLERALSRVMAFVDSPLDRLRRMVSNVPCFAWRMLPSRVIRERLLAMESAMAVAEEAENVL